MKGTSKGQTMEFPGIFSATLGLSEKWRITSISFAKETNRMDMVIDISEDGDFFCPVCGAKGIHCGVEIENWHHNNFLSYEIYLQARVPRVECCRCGAFTVDRPWSRAGSRFSRIP